ncbi:NADAR family protein [Marinobacter salsuginis]|jgi:ribA/ribD-fused uncharacterized protein|uniref:NADAR domain-containing protein n=1 Tax=Marinobacter salsuginis TaxID=418719 RepID=A0A5M3Q0E6_9GAMM|nr:NADAR family protein [Marinobacter salsuginis]GBO88653.1 hypothetical protein MSSD14B_23210 [Marinobacter salsuginis]|tara:strand:+ start:12749 stop:13369 length:621 start_codon:yes stop_codon:yes gene_type:complete
MKTTADFVFFWGNKDPFSNWHPSPFRYKGNSFSHVEQFMMFGKAQLFGDRSVAEEILNTRDPRKCKALGREVRGFVEKTWDQECEKIVGIGCREKFLQNPDLLRELLATGDRMIVEASPYDRIWGIGLKADHPDAIYPERWRGDNRLGKVISEVRSFLINNYIHQSLPERAHEAMKQALSEISLDSASSVLALDNEEIHEPGPSPG